MGRLKKSHCKRGHELSGDNLYISPKGLQYCKACQRLRERKYDMTHREQRRIKTAKYREQNPDYIKEWRELNPNYANDYQRNRLLEDPQFKLSRNLRRRLNHALKGNFKSGSAVQDLGCSIEQLKSWLMYQFEPGMTWENYGEWHIDHVKPLSSFDLTNREQLLEVCNWHNLQPLWGPENIRKGDRPWAY